MTHFGRPQSAELRLSEDELRKLIALSNKLDQVEAAEDRRNIRRWPRRGRDGLMSVEHIQGGTVTMPCATRNLSATGLSVLIRMFLHRGSPVHVTLGDVYGLSGSWPGTVMNCRYLEQGWHEAGIRFAAEIDPADYFIDDAERANYLRTREAAPKNLGGTVVQLTGSKAEAMIQRSATSPSKIEWSHVTTVDEALEFLRAGHCDVLIVDVEGLDQPLGQMLARIGKERLCGAVLAVSTSPDVKIALKNSIANTVLTRPYEPEVFRATLQNVLEAATRDNAMTLVSSLPTGKLNDELVEAFVADAHSIAEDLAQATTANHVDRIRTICLQLRGISRSAGYGEVFERAGAVLEALEAEKPTEAMLEAASDLATLCQRVRARAA